MKTNKPEVVAWGVPNSRLTERQPFMQLLHTQEGTQYPELLDPLIRLSDYEALQAEVDVLRKENQRLKDGALEDLRLRTSALEMMNAANSEAEALRKDAERYRWLRDGGFLVLPYDDHGIGPEFPYREDLDAAIDAELAKEEIQP